MKEILSDPMASDPCHLEAADNRLKETYDYPACLAIPASLEGGTAINANE